MTTTPAMFRRRPTDVTAVRYGKDDDGSFYEQAVDRVAAFMLGLPVGAVVSVEQMSTVLRPAAGQAFHPGAGQADLEMWDGTAHDAWLPLGLGCYVVKGVSGEFYPCQADIFEGTYDAVDGDGLTETKDARGNDVLHVFQDKAGEWRWQRKAANGQSIAVSGEGYVDRAYTLQIGTAINPGIEVCELQACARGAR